MMKKIFYLFAALVFISSISCSRYCCDVPKPMDSINASKNGSAWIINDVRGKTSPDSLTLTASEVSPTNSETITFKIRFNGTDNYTLASNNVVYGYIIGMDNPYVSYHVDSSFQNSLNVIDYQSDLNLIAGTFTMKLLKDPSNSDPRYPGTITFLNGSFRVQLNK